MALEIVVNNDSPAPLALAGSGGNGDKISNVIAIPAPKKPRKPGKKRLTPKQLFVRDVCEMGEMSDHLHAAAQSMSNDELKHFRARVGLVLEALRALKDDTADYVTVEEDEAQ